MPDPINLDDIRIIRTCATCGARNPHRATFDDQHRATLECSVVLNHGPVYPDEPCTGRITLTAYASSRLLDFTLSING